MLSKYRYYTGMIFKGYAVGNGDAIVKGGRYDNLLSQFGKAAPAVGFVVVIDDLLNALCKQERNEANDDEYLTFALTKGRLADKTLDLLESIGITCEEMKDKNPNDEEVTAFASSLLLLGDMPRNHRVQPLAEPPL